MGYRVSGEHEAAIAANEYVTARRKKRRAPSAPFVANTIDVAVGHQPPE
jgi:hypothetical protein